MRLAPFASRYAGTAMVCAIDHRAALAGVTMLKAGGSAVDAAVATSAVLAVTSQHMCGMGGDLFALVQQDGSPPVALNSSGRAGSGADAARLRAERHTVIPPSGDIRCVPVPGCVDGWLALHGRFGRLPIAEVLGPATDYAAGGFPASASLVAAVQAIRGLPGAEDFEAARHPGAIVRRPGVARALEAVASSGRSGFYGGEFGEGLIALGAGEYTHADLASPLADWVAPLWLEAFGSRIWTTPPNSQGYLTLAGAWIADGLELPGDTSDPLWAHLTIEAACQAAYDRTKVLHEHADGAFLLSPERLYPRRSAISAEAHAAVPGSYDNGDTVFLCAVDKDRMGVSLIQSNAASFGSQLAEPATAVFLQNRGVGFSLEAGHPAEYGPRRRPPHTLSPALLTSADNRLQAVLGTMGGDAQPQILLQLLCRMLGANESVGDAVAAGRWVLSNARGPGSFNTWTPGRAIEVELEPTVPPSWQGALAARGHSVVAHRDFGLGSGHAHVIACRDGYLEAASDPRGLEGAAAGY
jgi:gamma-glutamyltranspeptidase/glutathione hydrolase